MPGSSLREDKPRTPRSAASNVGKRARTRTGCWNCRRRRKKCQSQDPVPDHTSGLFADTYLARKGNERRPVCGNCLDKGEACQWGLRLSFRDDNVQTLPQDHPSMRQDGTPRREGAIEVCIPTGITNGSLSTDRRLQIVDITSEVIRDYQSEVLAASSYNGSSSGPSNDGGVTPGADRIASPCSIRVGLRDADDMIAIATPGGLDHDSPASVNTSRSYDVVQSAAVQLLDLTRMMDPRPAPAHIASQLLPLPPQEEMAEMAEMAGMTPEQLFADDGIFMPGSAYLELHSALRSHIFDTARSTYPSRWPSPDPHPFHVEEMLLAATPPPSQTASYAGHAEQAAQPLSDTTPKTIELTKQEEYVLWKNWVDEIAPWVCLTEPSDCGSRN